MTLYRVTGAELKELNDKFGEIIRRVAEGTITLKPTMAALQRVIEGEFEPKRKPAETTRRPVGPQDGMAVCYADGARCSIDGSFIDEGGTCQHGHMLGQSYTRLR